MLTIRREVTLEGVWGSVPRSSLLPGMGGAKAQVWIVFDLFEGPAQSVGRVSGSGGPGSQVVPG